tara:strand:+ start:8802 stop:17198 length:8397 start_codon:yes stop_codon:yes gene_type:complete
LINPYEGHKVKSLINTYRANPDMFNEEQLDELESLADQTGINFKRLEGNFNLKRSLQQAQAGFIEGLTTFNFGTKEPRTTGESIFRSLGHLAGFAPAIMKAPLSLLKKPFGKTGMYKAIERGITQLDKIAAPMVASRLTKKGFDIGLKKSGLESLNFLRQGAKTRAITEEALGLGAASAISSIWKGPDEMANSFVGGAIAGGAFGGIGNFVSVGKLYKGTPAQIDKANRVLRGSVASAFMGLPTTLRNDPIEMQMYEYLLGGFFGYNTRPAFEKAGGEWLSGEKGLRRNSVDVLDPEKSKTFQDLTTETKNYIINEHPVVSFQNSQKLKGSNGAALGFLEKNFPDVNWANKANNWAVKHSKGSTSDKVDLVNRYYRKRARKSYEEKVIDTIEKSYAYEDLTKNTEQLDFTDSVELKQGRINQLAKKIYKDSGTKLNNEKETLNIIRNAQKDSVVKQESMPNMQLYLNSLQKNLPKDIFVKNQKELINHFNQDLEVMNSVYYVELSNGTASVKELKGEMIQQVSMGEKYVQLPLDYLGYGKGFKILSHVSIDGGAPVKFIKPRVGKDSEITFNIDSKNLSKIQDSLAEENKYIYSGIKDKDMVMVADLVQTIKQNNGTNLNITKEMLFNSLSNGDGIVREKISKAYDRSMEIEKEVYNDTSLHDKKWISNVLHHAYNNNLVNPNLRNPLQNIHKLLGTGYGKSGAVFNKRMQIYANRMTPLSTSVFKKSHPSGKLKVIIIPDKKTTGESDTDGGLYIEQSLFDNIVKSVALDPESGHLKPVLASKSELGALLTKSNGQRSHTSMQDFMKKNGIDIVLHESSAKLFGEHQTSELNYNGNYSFKTQNVYEFPLEHLQISRGTFESPKKQIYGTEVPIQLYGQTNETQSTGYNELFKKEILNPSLEGTFDGKEFVRKYNSKELNINEAIKYIKESDNVTMDIPFKFISDYLLLGKNTKLTAAFMDKVVKLEKEGKLGTDFEFDTDSSFVDFHKGNKVISEAMRDTYVSRNSIFKKTYHNALKKYIIRRFSNPYIEHGGKSWLKSFLPEMMEYADIDPIKKTRKLREGTIYLDEYFRKMPIKSSTLPEKDLIKILNEKGIDAKKDNLDTRSQRITLGEAWKQYRRSHSDGISKGDMAKWNTTFNLLVIRTPADSMSGTRLLRFRGFTGQKGAGSFTHHKDNIYLGGADKDADNIKIFQGLSNQFNNQYKKVKNERKHWYKKDNSPTEYLLALEKEFKNKNISEEQLKEISGTKDNDPYYQSLIFSPGIRHKVIENAVQGKQGLGYGLNSKVVMQNWIDYIKLKKGSYTFDRADQTIKVSLKKNSKHKGVNAEQYFRDLGTLIVNKSADASNDPTVIPYTQFRKLLFDAAFKTEVVNKKTGEVSEITYDKLIQSGNHKLNIIKEAINLAKPQSSTRNVNIKLIPKSVINNLGLINKNKMYVTQKVINSLNLTVGENVTAGNMSINYSLQSGRKKLNNNTNPELFQMHELIVDPIKKGSETMSIFDVAHGVTKITNSMLGDKALKSTIPNLVKEMSKYGLTMQNLKFELLKGSYKKLYQDLELKLDNIGALELYSPKELSTYVDKHSTILTENLLFSSPSFTESLIRKNNMNFALDIIGNGYGQIASIELLHKNFINIHRAASKNKVKLDVISKLIPELHSENKIIKEFIRDKWSNQDGEGFIVELESKIYSTNMKLSELALKNKIPSKLLIDYFHTLLLSPIKGYKQKFNKKMAEINHDKDIHTSQNIPLSIKKEYYQSIESLHQRVMDSSKNESVKLETVTPKKEFLEIEKINNNPRLKKINDIMSSDTLEMMATNGRELKEIKEFQNNLKTHKVMSENFNEWFKYFTTEITNRSVPRDASTVKMEDIVAINKHIKSIKNATDMEVKLKHFNLDPRFVDKEMVNKGMYKRYVSYYAPVKTSTGFKTQPIYNFMSPIGSIAKYQQKTDRGTTKDLNIVKKDYEQINKFLNTVKENKFDLFKDTIDYREGNLNIEESFNKNRINKIKKLNVLLNEFYKKIGNKWIYTKDLNQNKVTDKEGAWELDKDFNSWFKKTKGVLNKYMKWNKDGVFDLEYFKKNVVEKNISDLNVINSIGIDGIKRYQYELKIEKFIAEAQSNKSIPDVVKYRLNKRKKYRGTGEIESSKYVTHMNFGYNKKAMAEYKVSIVKEADARYKEALLSGMTPDKAKILRDRFIYRMENFAEINDSVVDTSMLFRSEKEVIKSIDLENNLENMGFNSKIDVLQRRVSNLKGYDKRPTIIPEYADRLIRGYYKNLLAIKGEYEIRNMVNKGSYKPSAAEKKKLKGTVYKNYVEVWGDYSRLYLQSILGHQTFAPDYMSKGSDPLHLKRLGNLYSQTSDKNVIKLFEKLYQRKGYKPPFVSNAPASKQARIEYFSRKLHEFGRMEAQYELVTLLANTGTWATNIFGGTMNTIGSGGLKNFKNSFNNKVIYDRLLTNSKGEPVVKMTNGKFVKNKKDLMTYLEEIGVIDNFIQNEFEYNEGMKLGLKNLKINIKNFKQDISKAIKSDRKTRDETILEVIDKYGVKDVMVKHGSWFMQHGERVNRMNAFVSHALHVVDKYGREGKNLSINDDFVFDFAMKGIENTQFLYQNAFRPAFMRTATGKVLSRFKVFVWNSIRVRKEFYKQAKLYDFKEGTEEYKRFKDTFTIDMFMFALSSAFMFSIFDSALAPPYDWIQNLSDWMYGDKNERDMAFFNSKLGPANLLKPPIARVPEAMVELIQGDWEKFGSYTAYTMFPFGRAIRQIKQVTENPNRIGEIGLRLPVNKVKSRIQRSMEKSKKQEEIDLMLD